MLQKTQGIVLHSLKYKDTSIIVDIYTEVSGRASFLVPVSRSRKAAVKSVLFQPLSLVELEADFRPNTTIYKVKEAKSLFVSVRILISCAARGGGKPSFIRLFAAFHCLVG